MPISLSNFYAASSLVGTRESIQKDLAVLEDAERFSFDVGGIDFWRGSFPEERLEILKAGTAPRRWADDKLFPQFAKDVRALVRSYLEKDLAFCDRRLADLGIDTGGEDAT